MVSQDAPQFNICEYASLLSCFLCEADVPTSCRLYAKVGLANCVLLTPLAERSRASVTQMQHSSILLAAAAEGTRQTGIYHDLQSELYKHSAQHMRVTCSTFRVICLNCSAHESNLLNFQSELSDCSEHESYLLNDTRRRRRLLLSQQLRLQARNLPLELPQHCILGILIDARLVGDVLGSVGVAQRAQRLLIVVACWPNVGNHHCLGVATQRVLQQWTAMS